MRRLWCMLTCLMAYGMGTGVAAGPVVGHAEETAQRTARGIVVAANVDVEPQTIVIRVTLPNNEELIVGARVPTDTKITRGKHAARLADLKGGETVEITYRKASDGLIARSIHVR